MKINLQNNKKSGANFIIIMLIIFEIFKNRNDFIAGISGGI